MTVKLGGCDVVNVMNLRSARGRVGRGRVGRIGRGRVELGRERGRIPW